MYYVYRCMYLFINVLARITLIMLKEIRNCRFLEGHITNKRKKNEEEEKFGKR